MPNLYQQLRRHFAAVAIAATALAANTVQAQGPLDALSPPSTAQAPDAASPRVPAPQQPTQPKRQLLQPEPLKPGEAVTQIVSNHTKMSLIALDSQVIELATRIKVVDGHNPDVVSIQALSPNQLRIRAELPGVTKVKLIDEHGDVRELEILVETDTRELEAYLKRLFPGSSIEVYGIRDAIVLRGWVTEPTHIPRIVSVAETFSPTVHNQLDVAGTNQVQLHVKIIEVQRSKLREFGFNFVNSGRSHVVANSIGALATLSSPTDLTPGVPGTTAINSAALQNAELVFGITGSNDAFHGFLKALQSEAMAKVLAEPVLVTTSGRPASMLSGGQFPVLIPSGSLGTATISWREFGVRLDAVPIVLGNGRLRLDVSPEVSDRDFSSGVSFNGLVVPGIATRKVNTQVEMRFGETLMIGGLISTRRTGSTQKVPFLGELPVVGAAFSRKKYDWAETELLILVTPELAGPLNPSQLPQYGPGEQSVDPLDRELYIDGLLEIPRFGPEDPEDAVYDMGPPGLSPAEFNPGYGSPSLPVEVPTYPDEVTPPQSEPGAIEQTGGTRRSSGGVTTAEALRTPYERPSSASRRPGTTPSSSESPGLIGPGERSRNR
ncbi:MAG: type II and III secretion system protein family protein [Planctomycetaceae bacterium]|nr:type II and III secretion system protein family protein [Planctomycetaceae bacterium]